VGDQVKGGHEGPAASGQLVGDGHRGPSRISRVTTSLVTTHTLAPRLRSRLLQTLARMGETLGVEQALADMSSTAWLR
jgi:hypothetical protein